MKPYSATRYSRNTPEGQKAGRDLAGGFRGILLFLSGDMDYLSKTLEMPRWSRNENLCSLCRCTKRGPLSYLYNSLASAKWISEIWTASDWNAWPGRSPCPIFELWWLTGVNVFLDYMHVKYLGADQYIFGSVMYLICFVVLKEDNPKVNLAKVWGWIQEYYAQHKPTNRYRSLRKLTMFVRRKDFPKLRGKAAEIKGFGPVILYLWKKVMDEEDKVHRMIRLLLTKNLELDTILDAHPTSMGYFCLPPTEAEKFKKTMFSVGQLHKQLSEHFTAKEIRVFNFTAKSHMLMHLGLLSKYIHPKLGWCFQGEGFMRTVQTLLQSCVRGNHAVQAMAKATVHYNLGKQLQYKKSG